MRTGTLRANLQLLMSAIIWGFAFVAQRVAMDHLGPLAFNALRFALGALVLLPFVLIENRRYRPEPDPVPLTRRQLLLG